MCINNDVCLAVGRHKIGIDRMRAVGCKILCIAVVAALRSNRTGK